MASPSTSVTEDKVRPEEAKRPVDALAELRSVVARLNARTAALHQDINALSHFVRNTQAMQTELMSRLCDQVFRISDALHLLPVAQVPLDDNSDEDNNVIVAEHAGEEEEEEQGGMFPGEGAYRNQIL